MGDTRFTLVFIVTIMSTYFNRDAELESYLGQYNEEFEEQATVEKEVRRVFRFVDSCRFSSASRVWKKADLLTLLVEVHRALLRQKLKLDPSEVRRKLKEFYGQVDEADTTQAGGDTDDVRRYHRAAIQATNDRSSRITRGRIIARLLGSEGPAPVG